MPAIKQNLDQSVGFDGAGSPSGGAFVAVNIEYNASSVDKVAFVATRAYYVKAITGRPTVAGTNGGAVTAVIKKAASGTAITSGTALHSSTYDLKGTADTVSAIDDMVGRLREIDCFEDITKGAITEVSGGAKQFTLTIASKCP